MSLGDAAPRPEPGAGAALTRWLAEEGLACDDLGVIVTALGERLHARGVDLARLHVTVPTLHPDFASFGFTWKPAEAVQTDTREHGSEALPGFQTSPIKHCIDNSLPFARWRLDGADLDPRFPLLAEFRAAGLTDYFILLERFGRTGGPIALPGMVSTWATTRTGGFSEAEVALVREVNPLLALVAYRIGLHEVSLNLLDAYVGRDAGRRILGGQIRRGSVERIAAVVLFADLSGFTTLADRTPGETMVAWLNDYMAAMVAAIEGRGGEVLKFLGDGLLAIFPLAPDGAAGAHDSAISAAQDALASVAVLNRARAEAGLPTMALDIALHQGEVMYGNVGAARRLDFTIIGPTVNEAARMETLCGTLGVNLLLSAPVAEACGRRLRPLGTHRLRGVESPRALFTLEEPG